MVKSIKLIIMKTIHEIIEEREAELKKNLSEYQAILELLTIFNMPVEERIKLMLK